MPLIDLAKTQKYLEWLKTKLFLDTIANNATRRSVKRREVYRCNLGIGIGSEESKERPCVILQYDAGNIGSPNTIVAPITHTTSQLQVVVPISNKFDATGSLILDGNVLLGNIVCVSKARLGDFIVKLDSTEMDAIDKAIAISVDIKRHYDKLNNIYNDKLEYIKKLKEKILILETSLREKDKELNRFNNVKDELGLENLEILEKKVRSLLQDSMDKKI